jgi:neutral ceramidase
MRLRRALFIVSPCNGNRIVFVSADLGMVFLYVKQEVVRPAWDIWRAVRF